MVVTLPAVYNDRSGSRNALLHTVDLPQKAQDTSRVSGHTMVRPAEVLVVIDIQSLATLKTYII